MDKLEEIRSDSENLLEAHACFQEDYVSLSGKWRFLRPDSPDAAPEGWLHSEFDDRKWERTVIPCGGSAGNAGSVQRLTGLYRRSFILSRDRGSRRIIFRISSPPSRTELWVNGIPVGTAVGVIGDAEFDITSAIRPEKNQVCIRVLSPAGSEPVLTGDLGLYSLPGRCISDVQALAVVNAQSEPMLSVHVHAKDAEGFTARIALMEDNRVIRFQEATIHDGVAAALLPCPGVQLWSAETPVLYRIAVILWDGIANYHTRELTVGFRQVRNEAGVLSVNGQPEKIYATYYSLRDESTGAVRSADALETDLRTIRDHNFNGIWLTESAPDGMYGICDRIGLYVLEETGLGREAPPELQQRLFSPRANHPCVIGWDLEPVETVIFHIAESMTSAGMDAPELAVQVRQASELSIARIGAYRDGTFHGTFLSGFCSPEGVLRSTIREAKAALAPILCRFEDGMLTIENHSRFLSTGHYEARYVLTQDGTEMVYKPIELNVPPMGHASVPIETKYDIYKPGRYHLSTEFRRKDDGVTVAKNQWEAGVLRHIYDENPGGTIREESGRILLRSADAAYTIARSTACPVQIAVEEQNVLRAPLVPVFSEPGQGLRLPDEWERFTARWRAPKPSVLEVDQMTRTVTASFRLGSGLIQTYRLYADGSLSVELRLRTGKTAPQQFGWRCTLDPSIQNCRWFGLGPDPADPAHRLGRFFGIHTMNPENAPLRDSVYELTLTADNGKGVLIRSAEGLRFSLEPGQNGAVLTIQQPDWNELKPHTTYTFAMTVCPVK